MSFGRHFVGLMAAIIVVILTAGRPSVALAHAGHGHPHATAQSVSVVAPAPSRQAPRASIRSGQGAAVSGAAAGSARPGMSETGCCAGTCGTTCCGTLACCGPGMLPVATPLPARPEAHVAMIADDVAGLPGLDPEAIPEPPRSHD